ncbi:MAG: hypothetical protein R3C99_25855 [Pirellulaceae bacterium]
MFDGILWRFDINHDFQLDAAAMLERRYPTAHAGTGLRLKLPDHRRLRRRRTHRRLGYLTDDYFPA